MSTYIKFQGSNKNRFELFEKVIKEIERSHCYYGTAFSISRKPTIFTSNDTVYIARMTKEPNDYAIFGVATPIPYDDSRDQATPKDIEVGLRKAKYPCILRIKNPIFIDGRLRNCVLMSQIISIFGPQAFTRSASKQLLEEKYINPRLYLANQAFIELTEDASNWLKNKFELAVETNGHISETYLKSLPRPQIDPKF
jgi:hypothetical protein